MKKKIFIISTILILIAGIGFIINSKKSKKAEVKEVIVKKVQYGTFVNGIDEEGEVQVKDEKDIFVSKSQRIVDVLAEVGDEVKKGDVLITFDPDERESIEREIKAKKLEIEKEKINIKGYSLKISSLSPVTKEKEKEKLKSDSKRYEERLKVLIAEKGTLERELKSKKREYETKQKLFDAKAISQSELDDSENSYKSIENELEKKLSSITEAKIDIDENKRDIALKESELQDAKESYNKAVITQQNNIALSKNSIASKELEIETLKKELEKTVKNVVSPVDGTVITVKAEPNFRVNLEQSLMTIADLDSQIIKAKVLSSNVKDVKIGQKVIIKSENIKRKRGIEGTVSKISTIATTDEGNGYSDVIVEVEIEFDAKKSGLKPGYKVNCEIIAGEKENAVYISQFAIQTEKRKKYVMILDKNGTAKKVEVETGLENNSDIEVKNLPRDAQIIMNSKDLKDGEKVKVVDKITGNVKLRNNNQNRPQNDR